MGEDSGIYHYNGINKNILLLLWVEGVVGLGSRVCGSRGLWVEA